MKKLLLLVAISAITGVNGQIDRSVRPKAAAAPAINIKNSEVFKTANGITVVLSENHKLPRVSFNMVMGASPMIEGSKAGANQLMGQLLLSGTAARSKDVLDKEIDYMGATLNADGSSLYLSCLTKHLEKSLGIMQDVLMNPTFPESEFARIKKQAESGLLAAKSSPDEMAGNAERKINFPNHPNSDVMNEASLAAITRDDIVANFKQIFTPDGAYLVIVGDINKEQASKMVDQYFGSWRGTAVYKQDYSSLFKNKGNRVIFVNKPGAVQSVINVTFPVAVRPGEKDQLALNVLNSIFGGGAFGSRLMQNLREDKAYTYGCYSDLQVTRDGSWLSASGSFRNDVSDSAITQLLYEFNRIAEGYVTEDELNLAKSVMAGGFARSLESPQTIARFALNIIRNNLESDYYQNYLKRLDAITKEDVLNMAQKYFTNGFNIIVVGNEAVLDKIKVFDADGKIEKLDAFGNEVKDVKKATISADELLSNYVNAVTLTNSPKALAKKMKKIKSIAKETSITIPGAPMTLKLTEVNVAPNKEAMKLEAQGMVFQSSYFDGTKGAEKNMQTGEKTMTEAEIAAKKKSAGFFPEMSYKTTGMTYELKGIETINNKDYYVLATNDGESQRFDYYDVTTYMKYKTLSISQQGGETAEITVMFDDYREVNGLMIPYKLIQVIGEMSLEGTVKEVLFNSKIDDSLFK
ncbi:MAG: insulinase family protein [Fluviicola sp.]|nr:insulinase family protein [Fluviicola sp.]MBP6271560.1 insulinase family protein [Fluviicola sp.]